MYIHCTCQIYDVIYYIWTCQSKFYFLVVWLQVYFVNKTKFKTEQKIKIDMYTYTLYMYINYKHQMQCCVTIFKVLSQLYFSTTLKFQNMRTEAIFPPLVLNFME